MKLSSLIKSASFVTLLCLAPVQAQDMDMHTHQHDASERLGRVNFSVSCKPAARVQFNRATALLHSFWYGEAEKAYAAVAKTDPACAMAYWGVAMSLYHPVWAPASIEELRKGSAAVEQAKSTGAKTQREKDYIAAIETFYKNSDTLAHQARALAYERAMEHVYVTYPKDHEAAIFYALSLLGSAATAIDKTHEKQKKAAAILNKLLPTEPQHPGVAHYLIHSFDYPGLAELALPAARSYAKIAPSSPHALHMPSSSHASVCGRNRSSQTWHLLRQRSNMYRCRTRAPSHLISFMRWTISFTPTCKALRTRKPGAYAIRL